MRPGTILCYGDSNTYGSSPMTEDGSWFRYDRATRWPMAMAADLGEGWHVIEEGLPGRTTCHDNPFEGPHKNGLRLLPAALESHAPIDLLILMLGTNDLKAHLALPAPDIAKGIRTLLTRIAASEAGPDRRPPAVLVVAPVPVDEIGPRGESFAGGAEKSRRLAGMYAALAAEFGAGFLDAGQVARVSPVDGVHLSADAHLALGAAMAEVVRGL